MALLILPLRGNYQMDKDMITFVPTRGRPDNALELLNIYKELSTCSELVFIIDSSDPLLNEYIEKVGLGNCYIVDNETRGMAYPLNYVSNRYQESERYKFYCFMGDDHRPRTHDWDGKLTQAMSKPASLAYANDLFQGKNLPTMIAMTKAIVTELGGMTPPNMRHLYLDNFWLRLGNDLDAIAYLDDVIVEHMHPVAGKAAMDEGYATVNAKEVYLADKVQFLQYISSAKYQEVLNNLKAL